LTLAIHTAVLVASLLGVACIIALVLIIVAPWKRVRAEPPIPDDVEARLLLGERAEEIVEEEVEEEEEAREHREGGEIFDFDPQRPKSS
jgi:hypothetical protein